MKTICFGAVLWDVIEDKEYIGGALFNLAAHLRMLGCDSYMVSSVGTDELGSRALSEIQRIGINPRYVFDTPEHPTGTVKVTTSDQGLPQYQIHEGAAYDFIDLSRQAVDEIAGARFDVVCFGTLEQRSATTRRSLTSLLDAVRRDRDSCGYRTRIFCDLNLRQEYYNEEIVHTAIETCDILKLNEEELYVVRDMFFPSADDPSGYEFMCASICESFRLETLVVTKGAQGCAVYSGDTYIEVPGQKVVVADTVGSGDAFSAAFLSEYLATGNVWRSAGRANRLGAYVASKRGAIPLYDAGIRAALGLPSGQVT